MLRQEETVPSADEIPAALSMEMQRDETDVTADPSVSGLLKTSSLKGLPSSTSSLSRNVTGSPVRPMIEEEYVMPSPGAEIPEPEIGGFEETILEKSMPSTCKMSPVSPERTPPPSSGESLTAVLDETMQLIFETLEQSGIPDMTTFSAVLSNTTQTKKRVASLFNHLTQYRLLVEGYGEAAVTKRSCELLPLVMTNGSTTMSLGRGDHAWDPHGHTSID
ncbi:rad21_Rec8_N domain-containing protein [Trichonephila clavipes]|nr:rad21_Rec8_N domain-containing protein [Trichonephila clavipes]